MYNIVTITQSEILFFNRNEVFKIHALIIIIVFDNE